MGYERNDRRYGGDRYRHEGRQQDRGSSQPPYGTGDRSYYGGERERDRYQGEDRSRGDRDDDRGFFDRAGDEVRSWFGDDEADRRRREDERNDRREWERSGGSRAETYAGYGLGADPGAGFGLGSAYPTSGDYGRSEEGRRRNTSRGRDHDPHYSSWRDRQIESLDRDYDEYRQQNQSRFETEFSSWRGQRQTQRDSLTRVQEHQEVVGSDGAHVGTVDHVRGDRILLTKTDKDAGGHHHSIPSSWIESVDDKVKISKTADQAKAHWKDEDRNQGASWDRNQPGGQGARNLNRSVSGTY